MEPIVTTLRGPRSGPIVAVFAGIHGNEPVGPRVITNLASTLKLMAGTLHLVIAHPEAVKRNVRYIEKNLNRCFHSGNEGQAVEDQIARKLMKVLDSCDALLDIHSYNSPEKQPFLITETIGLPIARRLNFSIVSTGWSTAEPGGTDGYMESQGKIGLCAECGSSLEPDRYQPLAEQVTLQFLQYFGLVAETVPPYTGKQKIIHVNRAVIKKTDEFQFQKPYHNFEELTEGEVFATDGNQRYLAGPNEYIIFPRPHARIGDEAFLIGSAIHTQ